jgi:hypothetical protein
MLILALSKHKVRPTITRIVGLTALLAGQWLLRPSLPIAGRIQLLLQHRHQLRHLVTVQVHPRIALRTFRQRNRLPALPQR